MHEVGIVQAAVAAAERAALDCGAARIGRLVLRVGALAGVEPTALRFAFEAVSLGTRAEGATLEIEEVAAELHCARCAKPFSAAKDGFIFRCPDCGDLSGDIRRGRELELGRIDFP
jgi:hydrogenase nickel incorporation protein HypA/HybF